MKKILIICVCAVLSVFITSCTKDNQRIENAVDKSSGFYVSVKPAASLSPSVSIMSNTQERKNIVANTTIILRKFLRISTI